MAYILGVWHHDSEDADCHLRLNEGQLVALSQLPLTPMTIEKIGKFKCIIWYVEIVKPSPWKQSKLKKIFWYD